MQIEVSTRDALKLHQTVLDIVPKALNPIDVIPAIRPLPLLSHIQLNSSNWLFSNGIFCFSQQKSSFKSRLSNKFSYASRFGEVFASVTADNGTEFGELSDLESWGTRAYFAHPYSPSERGQNERHNGLLRRFLPKGTVLEPCTADNLFLLADEINRLP